MSWKESPSEFVSADKQCKFAVAKDNLAKGATIRFDGDRKWSAFSVLHPDLKTQSGSAYVRGDDLVATFEFGTNVAECYWRQFSVGSRLILESILSLRSTLLTVNDIEIQLTLSGLPVLQRDRGFFWTSQSEADAEHSMVLCTHPADHDAVEVEQQGDEVCLAVRLKQMERGVIRRLRFRLVITSEEMNRDQAASIHAQFSDSPIPLTT